MEKNRFEQNSYRPDHLPQSEAEWLETGKFNIETVDIKGRQIRCALTQGLEGGSLTTMVGGIPRDPNRRKNLPLINKLYGHLALKLLDQNESSLLYNQPATGGSSGQWERETFQSRTEILIELTKYFHNQINSSDHTLIGTSAGAYMAVNAVEQLQTQGLQSSKLILLSPAAYPKNLEDTPYGEKFTESVRQPWNIEESPIFSKLKKYVQGGGSVYITFFEVDDPPIPYRIQERFNILADQLFAEGGKITVTTIPNVAHNFRRIGSETNKNIVDNDSIRATAVQLLKFLTEIQGE